MNAGTYRSSLSRQQVERPAGRAGALPEGAVTDPVQAPPPVDSVRRPEAPLHTCSEDLPFVWLG